MLKSSWIFSESDFHEFSHDDQQVNMRTGETRGSRTLNKKALAGGG